MNLKERLQEDLKAGLKAHQAVRVSVIRLAKAAITNLEINRGHQLSDEEVIEVLFKEAKQRNDAIPEYEKANRNDIVAGLQQELAILQEYLPTQLTEDELRQIVTETIQGISATSKKEMGKVMTALMPKIKGRADGKLVNQIVNSLLN